MLVLHRFFSTFVLAIEMRVHCGLRLSIARASSALHSSCTAVALSKRKGVLLMEKRHVTTRETACCSKTDRVMTKGAKIGALDERSNL